MLDATQLTERTQPQMLARVALVFLDRCDLKGAEAQRMREVQQWLLGIAGAPVTAPAENAHG